MQQQNRRTRFAGLSDILRWVNQTNRSALRKAKRLLDELAQEIADYGFDEEQKAAIREFVRAGGRNAIETALLLLREGSPKALFAGMEYEAEVAE